MSLPLASEGATRDTSLAQLAEMLSERRQLLIGRILWLVVAVWSLGVLAAGLPTSFHQWQTGCRGTTCSALQLTPAQAQSLQTALGVSLGTYAVFALAITSISVICWVGAGVLLWRKLGQRIVLVVALQAITQGVIGANALATNGLVAGLVQAHSPWQVPAALLLEVNQLLFIFLLALFPTGRFVPRWMRWGAGLWTVLYVLYFAGSLSPALQSSLPSLVPVFLGVIALLVVAQVYRYRRVSTPVERQQSKWVLLAFIILIVAQLGLLIPEFVFAPLHQPDSLYGPVVNLLIILVYLVAPASLIIAILRYRLWDVDALINKALVYGVLTGLLAVIYLSLIIGMESLVGLFTKHAFDPIVLVISMLAIVALFTPLRTRIQTSIDRRFYRRKYDGEKTLAAFSATLQSQVDLDHVREQLLAVVNETMQPAGVALWLRPPERRSEEQAHLLERHEPVPPTRLGG